MSQEAKNVHYKTLAKKLSGSFGNLTNQKSNALFSKFILIENQTLFGNNWLLVNHSNLLNILPSIVST